MHTPLYDVAAAIVVVGIVVGVIGIAPIAIVVGTDEASGKEMAAMVEAMVEAVMSETTGVTRSEAVTPNGSKPDVAGWRMRKTVAKIAAANTSSGETTAAETSGVRGEAATAAESASVTAAESTTSPAVAATTATASAASSQSHVRRQRHD